MFGLETQLAGLASQFSFQNTDAEIAAEVYDHKFSRRLITFFLGADQYALSSEKVAEILHPLPVTPLPDMPDWLNGISNLRGEIAAIVNTRSLLGSGSANAGDRSRFIFLVTPEGQATIALPVDGLGDVLNLTESEIVTERGEDNKYFSGRAQSGGMLLHIIDTDKILAALQNSQI